MLAVDLARGLRASVRYQPDTQVSDSIIVIDHRSSSSIIDHHLCGRTIVGLCLLNQMSACLCIRMHT
jgi:hypothetical protein